MTIYKTFATDAWGNHETKYWMDKANAERYVAENDKPWTNTNGIVFHTVQMDGEIQTAD